MLKFGVLSSKLGAGGQEDHTSDDGYMGKGPNEPKNHMMFDLPTSNSRGHSQHDS